jgi:ribonuclease R
VFIPGRLLKGAMPGDVVEVQLAVRPRVVDTLEGEVIAVVRAQERFAGTIYQKEDGELRLLPDVCPELPLHLVADGLENVRPGDKVAVQMVHRGDYFKEHRVQIVAYFGSADQAKHCAESILYSADVEMHFPPEAKREAQAYQNAVIDPAEAARRQDYRDWTIFTIDAASTKDIDDAISVVRTDTGYRLGVHIADVSYYVTADSALDQDAFRRGTSVYYADSVVPMLPKALSNGICSLNEKEDRLAFSCIMELDNDGRVVDYSFVKSVICSRVKGVYSELNALLAGVNDAELLAKYAAVAESLPILQELYQKLARLRAARGAMEIESGEAKLLLNEQGRCIGVEKRERGETECMIEEFMLLANTCAANLAKRMDIPFVYRVHAAPDPARIDALKNTLRAAGVSFHFADEVPTTLELSKLLDETKGTNLERPVHTNVLRSMAKADYQPQPKGHYGLALADYAHYTSPIRRYPDLAIHRILTDVCAGFSAEELRQKYSAFAAAASVQSSQREVAAMRAERDIEDCYKAEYMQDKLGHEFDAVVSSVTAFGLYVELPNTVEGLVRAQALSGHSLVLTQGVSLRDAASGRTWRLGDAMRVRLVAVDIAAGNIDFEPVL